MAKKYKVPRGTRDFLPEELERRKYVKKTVKKVFERHGFQQIQTPIFEEFSLLAARSGEEIRERMFTFVGDDTEYALRPELTAPVCRLVATGKVQSMPSPYRLYYIGRCYRYERPQAGRYREFEQAGLELMGSEDPVCDAEVITVATRVLKELDVSPFTVKVGNIGILRKLLSERGFDFDRQNRIVSELDNLMGTREKIRMIKHGGDMDSNDIEYVKSKLEEIYSLQQDIDYHGDYKIPLEKEFTEKVAKDWLDELPQHIDDSYKWAWVENRNISENLANLLLKVSHIRGERDKVREEAESLLEGKSAMEAWNELLKVYELLNAFGVSDYEVVLGVARGLDFYTGTVFEIDVPALGTEKQVCGGGRYDRLVEEFGGPKTPATGFAFGFDRIVEALEETGEIEISRGIDVYIATVTVELKSMAINISEKLRERGIKVEIDTMGRSLSSQLDYANKRNTRFSLILGPDEVENDRITVRNMETGSQTKEDLEGIVDKIKDRL